MRVRTVALVAVLVGLLWALTPAMSVVAVGGFDAERPAGLDINPKHQGNWEPVVAVDPGHQDRVYQLITGINASACTGNCPGTSILFRRSLDGGTTFGPETFVCGLACKTIGWQFDPQIRVASDTNAGCSCGTIYAAFLDQFNPGVQLFISHDGGTTWSAPITTNGGLRYMDKPVLVISPSGRDVYIAFNDRFANMVVASHDFGHTFLPPEQVNDDHVWWYADGGAVGPNGDVYFAYNGETSLTGKGQEHDGPSIIASVRCAPSETTSCASATQHVFATAAEPPPCPVPGCYADYFVGTPTVAVDAGGRIVVAYSIATVDGGAKSLVVQGSADGATWSAAVLVNAAGDSSFPQIASGPTAGDVRLAWQDDRTGRFNTWYATSSDGGLSWGAHTRLSDRSSGAPYKDAAGYTFTDGDYFGIAVSSTGVSHVIWGEADGSSLYCCGDAWYAKGT